MIRSVVSVRHFCPLSESTYLTSLQVAIRAVPYRSDFYDRIAQGGSKDKLDVELSKWLQGLDSIVSRIRSFIEDGGFGKV
jgi:hypothetical protein